MKLYYYTTNKLNPIFDSTIGKDFVQIEHFEGAITPRSVQSAILPVWRYKVTITVHENDSSYRYRALMEKTQLVLKFSLPEYIEFPVGTWCEYMNQTFYLGCPATFKKNGQRNFEYTLNMGTLENGMADYKLHNTVDGRLKFSMCAKPHEFIEEIVKNLNERDGEGVWSVGDCIDAPEKTVEFNHTYIDAALQSVADAFGTEWEIGEDLCVSLHKVEYFKTEPVALSYGRGNGFVPGVGRASQADEKPIKRLYVEGTDRNIDRATYGAAELRLPKGKTLKYDGSHYEGEDGFVEANAHTYKSDADGTYIMRSDKISDAVKEDSLDCTEIYPSRVGEVSELVEVDADKNFYDIIDSTIPADLDFSAYIIPGETMTMIFQTGMLAGKEFEVAYYHEAKTVNGVAKAARRFEIKLQEFDGIMMPNETFKPVAGGKNPDEYAIFGIQLPAEYICNDEDKSGASWEMFKEAARHLYEHEEQKFTFSGELQGLWAKRNWMAIGGKLKVGGYVLFTDEHFAKDGTLIRITGIKDYLTAPYSPVVEISNSISGSSTTSKNLRTIEQTEVVVKDVETRMKLFTKRRFRDAKETIAMLDEAMLDNFDNAISPAAVQTMAMLVGDESLQFRFVTPITTENEDGSETLTWQKVDDTIKYDQERKILHIDGSYIEHLTLGITTIKANRDGEEYRHWKMAEYESPVLDQPGKKYYLYAAVNKTAAQGSFVLSSKAIPFAGGNGSNGDVIVYPYNYYLLVGVLNSEYGDERSFASLYGFTEILPGRITTDKIVSQDGSCYFDLENNEIGGAIKFLSDNGYITLIDGGYINTQLINVSELVANHIIAGDKDGRRVEITPENKAVEIYDEDGGLCTILEGRQYSSLSQLFGGSGDGADGVVIKSREAASQYGYGKGITWARGKVGSMSGDVNSTNKRIVISDVWHTDTPMEVTAKGNFAAHAYSVCNVQSSGGNGTGVQTLQPMQMSMASIYVYLYVDTYEDEALTKRIESRYITGAGASASASAGARLPEYEGQQTQSDSQYIDKLMTGTVKTAAGYHVLALSIHYSSQGHASNSISAEWGFTSGSKEDISATYKYDFYVSRYFANGFCLGTRKDSYIMGYKDGENGMAFIAENNKVGFKMAHDGIKTKMGGGWIPLPLPIFSAKIGCTESSATLTNCISFDSRSPSISRIERGTVAILFPEQWNDLGLSETNCFIFLTGKGGVMKGSIDYWYTSSSGTTGVRIQISDDSTTNDNVECWIMMMMRKYPT